MQFMSSGLENLVKAYQKPNSSICLKNLVKKNQNQ